MSEFNILIDKYSGYIQFFIKLSFGARWSISVLRRDNKLYRCHNYELKGHVFSMKQNWISYETFTFSFIINIGLYCQTKFNTYYNEK